MSGTQLIERGEHIRATRKLFLMDQIFVMQDAKVFAQRRSENVEVVFYSTLLRGGHEKVNHALVTSTAVAPSTAGELSTCVSCVSDRSDRVRRVAALMSAVTFSSALKLAGIASTV